MIGIVVVMLALLVVLSLTRSDELATFIGAVIVGLMLSLVVVTVADATRTTCTQFIRQGQVIHQTGDCK